MVSNHRTGTNQMGLVMRKPAFCICENKDADQLRFNREADQCLCFRYIDSIIPVLPNDEISSLQPSSVTAQPGLCRTWSEISKTGFLTTRLIFLCTTDYFDEETGHSLFNMSCTMAKRVFGFRTKSDTNRAVQPLKMDTCLKCRGIVQSM